MGLSHDTLYFQEHLDHDSSYFRDITLLSQTLRLCKVQTKISFFKTEEQEGKTGSVLGWH
jgi:hypothetical protein